MKLQFEMYRILGISFGVNDEEVFFGHLSSDELAFSVFYHADFGKVLLHLFKFLYYY
jgi:hypothetical protein